MLRFRRAIYGLVVVSAVLFALTVGLYARFFAEQKLILHSLKPSYQMLHEWTIQTVWKPYQSLWEGGSVPQDKTTANDTQSDQSPRNSHAWKEWRAYIAGWFGGWRDPVVAVTVWHEDHTLLYQTSAEYRSSLSSWSQWLRALSIWDMRLSEDELQRYVLQGKSHVQIDPEADYHLGGVPKRGPVLLLTFPVWNEGKTDVRGVVRYHVALDTAWPGLDTLQWYVSGTMLALFFLIGLTVLLYHYRVQRVIEKQYEINMELATSKARAESESQEKSRFLANISHELRTPLNAIIGFSEIIQAETMGPLANATYKDYIRDIHQSGLHLLSLINDILDFSKAEAQKLTVDMEEIVVNRAIRGSIKMLQAKAEQASLTLQARMPSEKILIMADHKRLKQVLLNLLSNAIKFTPEGGSVTVILEYDQGGKTVDMTVKDTGIGMSSKDIPRAMAVFGQVDNERSRQYEGTGLGLPLTKKLVELMRGQFTLMSEEGLGTTVTARFPLQRVEEGDETDADYEAHAPASTQTSVRGLSPTVNLPASAQVGPTASATASRTSYVAKEADLTEVTVPSVSASTSSDGLEVSEQDLPTLDASGITVLGPPPSNVSKEDPS